MSKLTFGSLVSLMFVFGMLLYSCKEDVALPENLVQFQSETLGIGENETEVTVQISLSRAVPEDLSITLQMETDGVTYGLDFTTSPAATGNSWFLLFRQIH